MVYQVLYTWLELTSAIVFEVRAAVAYVHATVVAIARLIVQIVFNNGVDICLLYHTIGIFSWNVIKESGLEIWVEII